MKGTVDEKKKDVVADIIAAYEVSQLASFAAFTFFVTVTEVYFFSADAMTVQL